METIFQNILQMSATAGCVTVVVLMMRLLLHRAPKKYAYALWAVVGFRLCCPFSFESVFSLFNLNPFSISHHHDYITVVLPSQQSIAAAQNHLPSSDAVQTYSTALVTPALPAEVAGPAQSWLQVGMVLWLIGLTVMALISLVSYIRLTRRLRTAVRLQDNVWQSDIVRSPFILGIFRPRIYIPFGLDDASRRYVLTHERYHLRHGDHVVKLIAYCLLSVHWFNPLCHIAFSLMNRDMEMRCDEYVLSQGGSVRKAYSVTLLSIASNRRFPSPSPLAFGEIGIKPRIQNALRWKKPRLWVNLTAIVLSGILLISCAANPVEEFPETTTSSPPLETTAAPIAETITLTPTEVSFSPPDGAVQWIYAVGLSSTTYHYFPFQFDFDYTSIEASCTSGKLVDLDATTRSGIHYPSGTKLRFEQGHHLYWFPYGEDAETPLEVIISFSVYREDQLLGSGDIHLTGVRPEENSPDICYYAILSSDNMYMQQADVGAVLWRDSVYTPISRSTDQEILLSDAMLHARVNDDSDDVYRVITYTVLSELIACGTSDDINVPCGYSEFILVALYQEFQMDVNLGPVVTRSELFPAVIQVDAYPDGSYGLSSYWEPDNSSSAAYEADVLENVPQNFQDNVLNIEKFYDDFAASCFSSAIDYYGIDTSALIDELIEEITSSPAHSSSPGDYIRAHPEEYEILVLLDSHTLKYAFQHFLNRGGAGLHGYIMALACQDIIDASSIEFQCEFVNGLDWFNQFYEYAKANYDPDATVRESAIYYLMDMVETQ